MLLQQVKKIVQNPHKEGIELLECMLKNYGLNNYEILVSSSGKPYLASNPVYFSISHSYNYVICVLSDTEVGVDIELIRDYNHKLNHELGIDADNNTDFFKQYTQKEAYLKCKGLTLKDIYELKVDIKIDTVIKDGYAISICKG